MADEWPFFSSQDQSFSVLKFLFVQTKRTSELNPDEESPHINRIEPLTSWAYSKLNMNAELNRIEIIGNDFLPYGVLSSLLLT